MDKLDKIQRLHRLFRSHRYPIPMAKIAEELECTKKTAKTVVELLRDQLNAPLLYSEETRAWYYDKNADAFELPGLWLTASELHSLAAILNILQTMEAGLLGKEINIVQKQVEKLIHTKGIDTKTFSQRIKYLSISKRPIISQDFSTIVDALIKQKQILINYRDYAGNETQRDISPQTLIHYQENWYIDAWCHKRKALRSFMLPRITRVIKQAEPSKNIEPEALKAHYQTSYGLFAGEPKHTACIKFYPPVTNEVAAIQWHPQQIISTQDDAVQIEIPYNDDRELICDILKYGNNAEVLKPAVLKNKIKRIVQNMLATYTSDE